MSRKKLRKTARKERTARPAGFHGHQARPGSPHIAELITAASGHLNAGSLKQAEQIYLKILAVDSANLTALYNMGIITHQTGRPERAADFFRITTEVHPQFAPGYNSLGIVLEERNEFTAAKHAYRQALDRDPNFAEAHYNLGSLEIKLGETAAAIENLRKALSLAPDYLLAQNNLAYALHQQGDLNAAIACYRQVLARAPNFPVAHNNLGNALKDKDLTDEAYASFQMAITLKPDYAEAYYNLGTLCNAQGMFDEAVSNYARAIELSPAFTRAHSSLAKLKTYSRDDVHLAQMVKLVEKEDLSDENRMHLAFGLAKAFDDVGMHEKAFAYLAEGNRLKRGTYTYTTEESANLFETIRKLFAAQPLAPLPQAGASAVTPIFIVGMPRSGTSLVEQILASHSDVFGAGETDHLKQTLLRLTNSADIAEAINNLPHSGPGLFRRLAAEYLARLSESAGKERYITDKMPYNFLLIGFIHSAMPHAKIIHCRRDPMDTCFSIFKQFFIGEHHYAYDLTELGQYYLLYGEMMRFWHEQFPGAIYDLGYESLVGNFEEEARKLLENCGLSWQSQCLSFHKTQRTVNTSSANQVRKPLYTSSIRLWEKYADGLEPLRRILMAGPGDPAPCPPAAGSFSAAKPGAGC